MIDNENNRIADVKSYPEKSAACKLMAISIAIRELIAVVLDELKSLFCRRKIGINDNFIHNKYGYCYYEIEPGKNPIIYNLYVYPEYRRMGWAKWLLQYVINEIRQYGYGGEINIEALPKERDIDKERLKIFYVSMGLTILNTISTREIKKRG